MKIAIKFGDNDFHSCFCGILTAIRDSVEYKQKPITNKNHLCKIINELSYSMYLLYQNRFEYNEEKSGELCERTKKYLQITPDKILLGEEVTEYLLEDDYNSDIYVLDESEIFSR